MATINEDHHSWKVQGILRRDFRHTHGEPEICKKGRKKKNTARWCRGKEGKEHEPIHFAKNHWHHVEKCRDCGKELKSYFPPLFLRPWPNPWCTICKAGNVNA